MGYSTVSKPLNHDDISGFEFSKELLNGEATAAINFDRLQKHPERGYIIIEYLLCEEDQYVTPYTSHPSRYWYKNASKFLSLWRAKCDFAATLYLVNYAKKGTRHADEVLLIEVLGMDENGITEQHVEKYTRSTFAAWFKKLNNECLSDKSEILADIYKKHTPEEIGKLIITGGKYAARNIADVYRIDKKYLEWMGDQNYPFSKAVKVYLELMSKV